MSWKEHWGECDGERVKTKAEKNGADEETLKEIAVRIKGEDLCEKE